MSKVALWENGGELLQEIETHPDSIYESVIGWLVDRHEQDGEHWCVTGTGRFSGIPFPAEYAEVIYISRG